MIHSGDKPLVFTSQEGVKLLSNFALLLKFNLLTEIRAGSLSLWLSVGSGHLTDMKPSTPSPS